MSNDVEIDAQVHPPSAESRAFDHGWSSRRVVRTAFALALLIGVIAALLILRPGSDDAQPAGSGGSRTTLAPDAGSQPTAGG